MDLFGAGDRSDEVFNKIEERRLFPSQNFAKFPDFSDLPHDSSKFG